MKWVPVVSKMKRTVQRGGGYLLAVSGVGPPCCVENGKIARQKWEERGGTHPPHHIENDMRRWVPPHCGENRNNDTTRRWVPPCCSD